jgi:two-component system, OmpR family, copper resistance phosphate regulon response regulator CusR
MREHLAIQSVSPAQPSGALPLWRPISRCFPSSWLESVPATRKVTRGGTEVELNPREFRILECLLRRQGMPVSRDTLSREAWGGTARATPLDNVIDVHMARLRRKIDEEHDVKLIHTIRGVGFAVREEES